jgi:hypothetical protein
MKVLLTILLGFSYSNTFAVPDDDERKTIYKPILTVFNQQLGNQTVPIKIYNYGTRKDVVMIHLHGNEKTSLLAGMQWLKSNGGLLIKIENGDNRNIPFQINGADFQFDPNHIFSIHGIKNDFVNNTTGLTKAIEETQKLAKKILSFVPSKPSIIVALHNNFNGDFSIDSYLKGRERARDAAKVNKNPSLDADDIFLTTDAVLYQQLSSGGFNTILQNANTVKKDGSLSVYFHEKKIRYLNCETEHGKQATYLQMLTAALKNIERKNSGEKLILYSCIDSLAILQAGMKIYKDSIFMGEVKSISYSKKDSATTGKFSWPEKMETADTITLQPKLNENGKVILKIKSSSGTSSKSEKQVIKIYLNFIEEDKIEPTKTFTDSTIIE